MLPNNRVDYIDLAKGFCIVLVVIYHINDYFKLDITAMSYCNLFRMPLYFFLSGLFFKRYEGFIGFMKRKINKLLIPFLFFYLTTSILLPHILYWVGYDVRNTDAIGWQSFYIFIDPPHQFFPNFPIWFLLGLFNVNILFYCLVILSEKFPNYQVAFLLTISLSVGFMGYYLGKMSINLPMYFDSAMTALPFFVIGYIFRKHTKLLYNNNLDKYLLAIILIFGLLLFCSDLLFGGDFSIGTNRYEISFWGLYICGLIGTLFVLFISKKITRLPLLSYFGRYSIIILCTHNPIIQFLLIFIRKIPVPDWGQLSITLVVTMLLYLGIIPLFLKFLPYVTAQKDVIKIDSPSSK